MSPMPDHLLKLLQADTVLQPLSAQQRTQLIQIARLKRIKKGQVLYRKGDEPEGLMRVVSGRVRVGASTFSGNEFLLTTLVPGDWFGEISVLDSKPRTHDAVALEDCELVSLPLTALRSLCEKYAAINTVIVQLLCDHIRAAFIAIDDFLLLNPEQRLAKRVLEMQAKQAGDAAIKMSQQDISDLMGLSRQSVNKILKAWEQAGHIQRVYRGFNVTSINGLRCVIGH